MPNEPNLKLEKAKEEARKIFKEIMKFLKKLFTVPPGYDNDGRKYLILSWSHHNGCRICY